MKASQLVNVIGSQATVKIESLKIHVVILEAKSAFGSIRYLVQPIAGNGTQWIDECRLTLG